jgi:hypothetical protein
VTKVLFLAVEISGMAHAQNSAQRNLFQRPGVPITVGGLSLLLAVDILYRAWITRTAAQPILLILKASVLLGITALMVAIAYQIRRRAEPAQPAPPISAGLRRRLLWFGVAVGITLGAVLIYWQAKAEGYDSSSTGVILGVVIIAFSLAIGIVICRCRRTG